MNWAAVLAFWIMIFVLFVVFIGAYNLGRWIGKSREGFVKRAVVSGSLIAVAFSILAGLLA